MASWRPTTSPGSTVYADDMTAYKAVKNPHKAVKQWSTAAKSQHQPSAFVQNRDASVP